MDLNLAEELSEKLEIAKDQIVREEYEMLFLRDIFSSSLRDRLVFKGGTALRLAYGSPRFSDDLGFSSIKPLEFSEFAKVIKALVRHYPNVKIDQLLEKGNTLFALLKIKEEFMTLAFGIKVEVSKRLTDWKVERDFQPLRLSTPVSNIIVIGNTATLARIKRDKEATVSSREEPRDIYDLWFICGRLKEEFELPKQRFSLTKLRANLNRVLPRNERYIVEHIFKLK